MTRGPFAAFFLSALLGLQAAANEPAHGREQRQPTPQRQLQQRPPGTQPTRQRPRTPPTKQSASPQFHWRSFRLDMNLLSQSSQYAIGAGAIYTPRVEFNAAMAAGFDFGVQLTKSASEGMFPVLQSSVCASVALGSGVRVLPGAGVAWPIARADSAGASSPFPFVGAGVSFPLAGIPRVQSARIGYDYLMAEAKTHQLLAGLSFTF